MIILSTTLMPISGTYVRKDVSFPKDLSGCISYVGHPQTQKLLEALGATTNADNGYVEADDPTNKFGFRYAKPGKWQGPEVGESFLSVPLANNQRSEGWTENTAIDSVAELKASVCTRIYDIEYIMNTLEATDCPGNQYGMAQRLQEMISR